MSNSAPAGLILRGKVWHINKTVTYGKQKTQLRESTGASSLQEARVILDKRVTEAKVALVNGSAKKPSEHTWGEASVEYILHLEARGKKIDRAKLDIQSLFPFIGDKPLSGVHELTLKKWTDLHLQWQCSSTIARAIRTCSAVLSYAARSLRDANDNPWLDRAVPQFTMPDTGAVKPYRLTWEEQDRLVNLLPAHLVAPVLFAINTGARQEEICSLTWKQARTVTGLPALAVWWIPPEVRKASARRSKSQQEGRYVVCNSTARSILAGQKGLHDTWVFPSPKGERMFRINNHGWRTACAKAGLTIRFHDLRHSFGERLAEAGAAFDARKTLLGHDHKDITSHYSNPGFKRLLEDAELVTRDVPTYRVLEVVGGTGN